VEKEETCQGMKSGRDFASDNKAGGYLFGILNTCAQRCDSIAELLSQWLDIALAALAAGVIIGIPGGIAAYFITRAAMSTIRSRKKLAEPGGNHSSKSCAYPLTEGRGLVTVGTCE